MNKMRDNPSWEEGWAAVHRELARRKCYYPGCFETAKIECHMIGCGHKACEVHGNGVYEEHEGVQFSICWDCVAVLSAEKG
jgi:hypothetical protein